MQKIHNIHNWISELPDEVARKVRDRFTTRKLISGEYLYRQGDFSRLYEAYPDIPKALNRVMAYRLRLVFMLSEDSSLLPLRDRLARAVVRLGHTFGKRGENREVVIAGISHEDLARLVGATRPSVGLELKKLQQEGSIEIS